jgi:uncharacterized protein with HEPN domain
MIKGISTFGDFLVDTLVHERNLPEKWGFFAWQPLNSFRNRLLAGFPGANIKEFWLTILSEAKRSQI